jgi:hypothetical protein
MFVKRNTQPRKRQEEEEERCRTSLLIRKVESLSGKEEHDVKKKQQINYNKNHQNFKGQGVCACVRKWNEQPAL